jgi:hypothetical protein
MSRRRLSWWGAGILGACGAVSLLPLPPRTADVPEAAAVATPDRVPDLTSAPPDFLAGLDVRRFALGRGRTLTAVLAGLGLAADRRLAVEGILASEIDPRRLRAETGLTVGTDGSGELRLLAIRPAPDRWVRLSWPFPHTLPAVETLLLPTVTTIHTVGGVIESSVARAMPGTAEGVQLTLAFADVFQWDIDLLIEPRSGDAVRVVYEALRLGEVPADLPDFGSAPSEPGAFLGLGRILAASYEGQIARSSAYWVEHADGSGDYYDADGQALRKTFLKSPLNYRRISSGFSRARRHPVTRRVVPHHGVDFAAPHGTPVVAAADGRVSFTGWSGALGLAVRVRHGSEYETVYGHLSRVAPGVSRGASVSQNEVIGYVGATGRATGPHLHYTLIERGRPIDPMGFDNPEAAPLARDLRPRLERAKLAWTPVLESIPLELQLASSHAGLPGA